MIRLNEYGRWERLYRITGSYSRDLRSGAVYAESFDDARAQLGGVHTVQVVASGEIDDLRRHAPMLPSLLAKFT